MDKHNTGTLFIELNELVKHLERKECWVYLCAIVPRKDSGVNVLNGTIRQICNETSPALTEIYYSYVYGNRNVVRHYSYWDSINFNNCGSRTLES